MKRLGWIALAVLASLLLAWWLTRPVPPPQDQAGDLFLPEVALHINAVDHLLLEGAGNTQIIELRRSDGRWQLVEPAGYPADPVPVRRLLDDLSGAKLRERKTADANFHSRLGVQDVSAQDAPGVQLTLEAGERRWAVVLGENSPSGNGRYARLAGEDQVWELDRAMDFGIDRADWLAREVVDLDPSAVRLVSVVHPDGEQLLLRADDNGDFTLSRIDEGLVLKDQYLANQVPEALSNLRLSDVLPAAELDWSAAVEVAVTMNDGSGLRSQWLPGSEEGGDAWLRVVELWAAEPVLGDEDEAADDASEEASAAESAPEGVSAGGEDTVEQPIAWQQALQARGLDWAYQVPAYRMQQVARHRDELLGPPESEDASGGDGP